MVRICAAAAAAFALASGAAQAQPAPAPVQAVRFAPIRDNVYWAPGEGRNGNSGAIVGRHGVIVIDVMASEAAGHALLDEAAKLSPKPIEAVILTGAAGEAIQGLGAVAPGTPIIAHEAAARRMAEWTRQGVRFAPPKGVMPTRLIHGARQTLTLDGVRMEMLHLAPGHTDTEMAIYLPRQKIVFAGWVVQEKPDFPIIHGKDGGGDFNWGGSSKGWIAFTKGLLALDADTYVIGKGGLWTKAQMRQRLESEEAVLRQIEAMVAAGKSHDEIRQALGPQGSLNGRSPDFMFSEIAYDEVVKARRP